jgi:hypothetical protein
VEQIKIFKYREKVQISLEISREFLSGNKIILKIMIGKEAGSKIDEVPVSNNTISRRVDDMSHDFEDLLSEILKNTNFAPQVDKSTGITSNAQLLAFVLFENKGEIMEDFCCFKELPETSKGQDIFNILSSYLESCGLSWSRRVGICTDGAPPPHNDQLNKGFVTLVKETNPNVITTHCVLHREVLVSKTIGEDLKQVLDVAVNMVNFMKQRPLKSRMFAKLSKNMQKDHVTLLQNTKVRWR